MIAGLVLAAGGARRFGSPKQLAPLHGRPLLEHVLAALAAAPLDRVLVVLGAHAEEVRARVDLHGAEPVLAAGWEEGMATSLRAGLAALPGADAVVVALGDMPGLRPATVAALLAHRGAPALAVRATYAGRPGHPVLLERPLLDRAAELRGDEGFRPLLAGIEVREVACAGDPADVDTPEELEAFTR